MRHAPPAPEELETVLIKVKLIVNNDSNHTHLAPNHLFFERQLLCFSNTKSTVVNNLAVLSSTIEKINRISNHFWHRWRFENVLNLGVTQRASKLI